MLSVASQVSRRLAQPLARCFRTEDVLGMKHAAGRVSPLSFWKHRLEKVREKKGIICDMDGVILRGGQLIDGSHKFYTWALDSGKKVLFLTNTSRYTRNLLRERYLRLGLDVPVESFYTSSMATAAFLASQKEKPSAFVIGEKSLMDDLMDKGITLTDKSPDYVVVGEGDVYSTVVMNRATNLVKNGAKLIGTNNDSFDPVENDAIAPACGAWISVIEKAAGVHAYFVGKPNPLMARMALNLLNLHAEDTMFVGDRMDTDIVCGVEAGVSSVLVLTGVSSLDDLEGSRYAYQPYLVIDRAADLVV